MAIRTKEEDVPSEFPRARLFLDDIEEIVRIFRELIESRKLGPLSTADDPKIKVRFSTAGEECDDIKDLPKIAKRFRDLKIEVTRGNWVETSLTLHPMHSRWSSWGLSKEDTWSAFHKLQPVFKKRIRLWGSLLQSLPWWAGWPLWLAFLWLFPEIDHPLAKLMPQRAAIVTALFLYAFGILAVAFGSRETYLTPRYSWEPSPVRHYLKEKLVPVVVGTVLGIGGTILGLYLRHKFWP
jgi:hypothetical protein